MAWTPDGNIVVADYAPGTLREFDPSGKLLGQLDSDQSFRYLHGVAVNPSSGEIYAADQYCVYWLTSSGSPDGRWCDDDGSVTGGPTSIAAGPAGTVYVYAGSNMAVLGPGHRLLRSWSVPSTNFRAFAVDAQGNSYISDFGTVKEFDPNGAPVASLAFPFDPRALSIYDGKLFAVPAVGDPGSASSPDVYTFTLTGDQLGPPVSVPDLGMTGIETYEPDSELAVGPQGIVATTTNHQITVVGPDGTAQAWGSLRPDDFSPSGVLGNAAGDIYVIDFGSGHDRIIKYDVEGDPPTVLADLSSYLPNWLSIETGTMDDRGDIVVSMLDKVLTISQQGKVVRDVTLACPKSCDQGAVDPSTDNIYMRDFNQIDKFAPDGTLLATWPIWTLGLGVDGDGNFYTPGDFNGIPGLGINKYSPDGQLLTSFSVGGDFEPVDGPMDTWTGNLFVDARGRIYTTATDGIHIIGPSGALLAVWPFVNPNPLGISASRDGDVFVTSATTTDPALIGTQVIRYYGLLDPLPPIPPANESPLGQYLSLDLNQATQTGTKSLHEMIGCTDKVSELPTATCAGTLTVTASGGGQSAQTSVTPQLARIRFSVPLGRHRKVAIRLNARARRLLSRVSKLHVRLTAVYRTGPRWKTRTKRITLKGRHRHTRRPRHSPGRRA